MLTSVGVHVVTIISHVFLAPKLTCSNLHMLNSFFRYIEIFKSKKTDIKYVSAPKLKPLMSTRPGPYDRSGGFGGGRGRFGGGGNERR